MSDIINPKPKGSKKKILLVVSVVLVVLLGAGVAGFNVWHEQPTFCNAICHSPMDSYVESYEEGSSIKDDQQDAVLLVTQHKKSNQAIACLDCHEAKLDEQVSEGMKWISGDFSDPLKPMRYDGENFCLKSGCHGGITSKAELIAKTANLVRNPHDSHIPDMACDQCHKIHEQSEMMCYQCHTDVAVPKGWKTP